MLSDYYCDRKGDIKVFAKKLEFYQSSGRLLFTCLRLVKRLQKQQEKIITSDMVKLGSSQAW